MHPRIHFPNISSRAFEHPADRAALTALRKVPGFDLLLRKVIGLAGERSLRFLYLGSAVRVGPRQFPLIDKVYEECLATLDIRERPELFVAQTPFVNAGAIGVEKPFIVLNSATVNLMTEAEIGFVLGHELAHILSDHALYRTMLYLLVRIGLGPARVPLGGLAISAIVAALTEWSRKSEVSCDRAGLLCTQNLDVAYGAQLKLAGGSDAAQTNVDELLKQAEEYEAGGNVLDSVFKLLNVLNRSHPPTVLRLLELKRFADSPDYRNALNGIYPTRDGDPKSSIYEEIKESAGSYQKRYYDSKDPLLGFLRDLTGDISDAASTLWEGIKKKAGRRGSQEPRPEDRKALE